MSELRQKTINGVGWSAVSLAGRQGLNFIIGIILARLLSPQEFGLLAMVTILTNFASIFAELGFSAALVQKQDVQPVHLSSVFWLNLGMGLLLSLIFIAAAPLIAGFYKQQILVPITMLVSLNFFIGSFNIVQNTLLTKSLNFRTLSKVEIAAAAVSGTVAVIMAYAGFGVWSLAVQSTLATLASAVALWFLNDWRPSLVFKWSAIKDLLGFSTSLFGTKLLNYWVRNLDYLLIGRVLGTNPLGIYNRAYDIMLTPLTTVSRVLGRVMFPSFSIIQSDKERVKRAYLQLTRTTSLITFPMMLGLLVAAEPFVLTILGSQWSKMIPILRIFSLVGMAQSISTFNGSLYLSQGRANLQFKVGLVLHAVPLLGIVIGLHWGILGVAVGYATGSFLILYPGFRFAGGLVNLTPGQFSRTLASVFGCAVFMAASIWSLGKLLPRTWPSWAVLTALVLSGSLVYWLLVHSFKVKAYQEVRHLASEQWQQWRGRLGHIATKT